MKTSQNDKLHEAMYIFSRDREKRHALLWANNANVGTNNVLMLVRCFWINGKQDM